MNILVMTMFILLFVISALMSMGEIIWQVRQALLMGRGRSGLRLSASPGAAGW